ncbi:glycosyltransferase, partial [Candidatus Auribacterota bacterium]
DPYARLILIGGYEGMEKYHIYLKTLLTELDLADVTFAKHITLSDLVAYYSIADAFLCMSEHEGFCIPLLEAVHFNVPIFAFNACAIPETLSGGGILILKKDFKQIAELIKLVLENDKTKTKLVQEQKEKMRVFERQDLKRQLETILQKFITTKD